MSDDLDNAVMLHSLGLSINFDWLREVVGLPKPEYPQSDSEDDIEPPHIVTG